MVRRTVEYLHKNHWFLHSFAYRCTSNYVMPMVKHPPGRTLKGQQHNKEFYTEFYYLVILFSCENSRKADNVNW